MLVRNLGFLRARTGIAAVEFAFIAPQQRGRFGR
jgi:Flp pilus assembly protein TadG